VIDRVEAAHGPTATARLDAVDHLKELGSERAEQALSAIAADESVDGEVRRAAASAVAAR
jgi:HEAT repeat protein